MKLTAIDYVTEIEELANHLRKPGLLLVVPDTKRPANAMAIGWATFGRIWGQLICMVMVRPSRYTYDLLNRAGVFTVNYMPKGMEGAVGRCGQVSGRDVDKIAEQGWTVQPGATGAAPTGTIVGTWVAVKTGVGFEIPTRGAAPIEVRQASSRPSVSKPYTDCKASSAVAPLRREVKRVVISSLP